MIKKELIGLYLDNQSLYYVHALQNIVSKFIKSHGLALKSSGLIHEGGDKGLRTFLQNLSPNKKCNIYLALTRDVFFVREFQLPLMPIEDALLSAQNTISSFCHIPLVEIYYDIHLSKTIDNKINVLFYYCPKKEIDIYRDIFKDTGHIESLKAVFPLSYGVGAWFSIHKYPMPMGLTINQDKVCELAIYNYRSSLFSMTWPKVEGTQEKNMVTAMALSKFAMANDAIFSFDQHEENPFRMPMKNVLSPLPLISDNLAVAALSPIFAGQQMISIDDQPVTLKIIKPIKFMIPIALGAILLAWLMMWQTEKSLEYKKQKAKEIKEQVDDLKRKLKPMELNRETLEQAEKSMTDIEDFMKERPKLFSILNDLAKTIPEDTWFSHFNFDRGDSMILNGTSQDALNVVEVLRKSTLFEQVTLKGSVSRVKNGEERFTINIKLKKEKVADKNE